MEDNIEDIENGKAIESLLGKGLIIERYDLGKDDFIREVTDEGLNQIKEILKDKKFKMCASLMKQGISLGELRKWI